MTNFKSSFIIDYKFSQKMRQWQKNNAHTCLSESMCIVFCPALAGLEANYIIVASLPNLRMGLTTISWLRHSTIWV